MEAGRMTPVGGWLGALTLALAGWCLAGPAPAAEVTPEAHGAAGDGTADDTSALRAALEAAAGGSLVLAPGKRYRLSGPLEVTSPTRITGGGTLVATGALEEAIGAASDAGVLTLAPGAEGSEVREITIDLAGTGRTAVQVNAGKVVVADVEVRDYFKPVKGDAKRYSTSDSGVRIHGDGVAVTGLRCIGMRSGQPDSAPRCVTVQAGARGTRLSSISGERVNGGITVGRSSDVVIQGWRFRELEDNGLYVLPDAKDTVALDGELEDTEEPAVFKGTGTRVKGLKVTNQGRAFGIENARDLVLESVRVDFTEGFEATPAFLRARRGNRSSEGIVVRDVRGRMLLGDAVFSLAQGQVGGFVAEGVELVLDAGKGAASRRFSIRHRGGTPGPRFRDVRLELAGPPERLPKTLSIALGQGADPAAVTQGLSVIAGGRAVEPRVE